MESVSMLAGFEPAILHAASVHATVAWLENVTARDFIIVNFINENIYKHASSFYVAIFTYIVTDIECCMIYV